MGRAVVGPLLDQKRSIVEVGTKQQLHVARWRTAIADIAKRTSTMFPVIVLNANTIEAAAALIIGEASRADIPIRSSVHINL